MSTFENYLEGIINIFHQYSVRVGHPDTLSKSELKKLLVTERANTIKVGNALSTEEQVLEKDSVTRTVVRFTFV
jgi:hypothetical protein